ncbi:peptidyl-prolyl cis-trans isomerase [Penicillium angulare]|uniref:peptidylprolyl isomerase n=1 Tax=Penicillium angulare TaxID=116970 RepID=A0A9W9FYS5_9EURO|nr:peptidyl-prolyl cis-trans isomerase [Penicillium angulare]
MGFTKTTLEPGNGVDFAVPRSQIAMHYTGCLYDASQPNGMGKKFDSSYDRHSALASPIGVGRLIKGWDEGVPQMTLGEKAILDISPDFGYGPNGFPPVIPPNARLVFEVWLVKIGSKNAPGWDGR